MICLIPNQNRKTIARMTNGRDCKQALSNQKINCTICIMVNITSLAQQRFSLKKIVHELTNQLLLKGSKES